MDYRRERRQVLVDRRFETEWDWSKEEKGTDGDEFIVKRTGDTITMDCPSNPSVLKEKKCVLTFTYGYVGSDTR